LAGKGRFVELGTGCYRTDAFRVRGIGEGSSNEFGTLAINEHNDESKNPRNFPGIFRMKLIINTIDDFRHFKVLLYHLKEGKWYRRYFNGR
jgi:hypothetical protein